VIKIKLPDLIQAQKYLQWAEKCNPGPWVSHSKVVARAAGEIAAVCGLDKETAQVLGMLHDLGRYKGVTAMQHIIDGYEFLLKEGFEDAAQICITHSFPIQDISVYSGENDCSPEMYRKITHILFHARYTDYDQLIQLCDSLALPAGVCLLEKRLFDVALRHGVNEQTIPKWKAIFNIWEYFTIKSGTNLYDLFEEVESITFET